ncbi:hypothetical protein V6N11_079244 [Hibiscus sabdariffa]|uniref:F-box associated beta-propeller type 1 domain-containing protein n=1 Tax=Hibiscus sabdariffa TaxID=183260 RepID=A0ABR2RUT0_9ROSI
MFYNVRFGFDSRTNDYKLVVVGVDKGDSWIQPYLFSLNENCWKRVPTTLPTNYSHLSSRSWIAPFVNGAVHWLGYQKRNNGECSYAILGFDLSAEGFFHINLPESFTGLGDLSSRIMGYGESCIAVFKNFRELRELWVMKEYGVVESWTKVLTLYGFQPGLCVPLVVGFRKNGQVLLQVHNVKMVLLNLNTQQMEASLNLNCQQFDFHGCSNAVGSLCVNSYVKSLVLLDKAVDVRSYSDVNHPIDSSDPDESSGGDRCKSSYRFK